MQDFHDLTGEKRHPTWAEREKLDQLAASGAADVYVPLDEAPPTFWSVTLQAVGYHILAFDSMSSDWNQWEREFLFATGWGEFHHDPATAFRSIVGAGQVVLYASPQPVFLSAGERLTAIEHLLDLQKWGVPEEFQEAVNGKAQWFRVGVRLEGYRFVSVTSEHIHEEVVKPTLLLLASPGFAKIDGLYRKAFDRSLAGDPAGAITAACTSVEEMLRVGLGVRGKDLEYLASRAKNNGLIGPGVQQMIVKLSALRQESDAHTAGTDEDELASLTLHITASLLTYLARTFDF